MFHGEWEKRAFALTLAMGAPGGWNIDMSRFARENRPPGEYLGMTYYQIWLAGLRDADGRARPRLAGGNRGRPPASGAPKPVPRTLKPDDVAKVLYRGGPTERDTNTAPRFAAGDRVRAKNIHPRTHTRLPRYVRGHEGVIEKVRGCHVFPDSNSLGAGEDPQWLYTVRFEGARAVGAGQRSGREGVGRCVGAVS